MKGIDDMKDTNHLTEPHIANDLPCSPVTTAGNHRDRGEQTPDHGWLTTLSLSGPLQSRDIFATFRQQARALLAAGVTPDDADAFWLGSAPAPDRQGDLFATAVAEPSKAQAPSRSLATSSTHVPRRFLQMARLVVLHQAADRFARLYRQLWRLMHEPGLRHDLLDPDWLSLRQMAHAVQRDAYKMRAFVRFRPVHEDAGPGGRGNMNEEEGHGDLGAHDVASTDPGDQPHDPRQGAAADGPLVPVCPSNGPLHVAWFEPEHDVLSLVGPWFARRFAGMRWAILTPRGSLRWHPLTGQLQYGPPARREDAPVADAGEALWLTYYRHTFNPARLNLSLMQRHMPGRYWANLPEAAEIHRLAAEAPERLHRMTSAPPINPQEFSTKPVKSKNT